MPHELWVMHFCRAFGLSPLEYAAQPADVVARWRQLLTLEAECAAPADDEAGA